eukprot:TRINITY_DN2196_c0_g1_i1.p1 TRINITY_DN2196_c0_g1~~TRINITY_DN2196_c0_g1_i1.p1  ORF type:complete len:483 (+),score=115.27 TRINITY_DN2196_c0_g1_i1:380-1828(+)
MSSLEIIEPISAVSNTAKEPAIPPPSIGESPKIRNMEHKVAVPENQGNDSSAPASTEPKPDTPTLIAQQMEYYLSDRNLVKDKFLREQLQKAGEDGYLPLETFTSFPKMRKISTNTDLIRQVLRSSEVLDINAEGTMVRRRVPFVPPNKTKKSKSKSKAASAGAPTSPKADSPPTSLASSLENAPLPEPSAGTGTASLTTSLAASQETPVITESKTIYVAHIPKGSDKTSIQNIFGVCGVITRIDIPVDKKNGEQKGTSFIEYETEDEAKKAIEFFNEDENLWKQIGVQVRPYKMRKNNAGTTAGNLSSSGNSTGSLASSLRDSQESMSGESANLSNSSESAEGKKSRRGSKNIKTRTLEALLSPTKPAAHDEPTGKNLVQDKTPTKLSSSAPRDCPLTEDSKYAHFGRRTTNRRASDADMMHWDPNNLNFGVEGTDAALPRRRPRLFEPTESTLHPLRQPKGPDGSKGFAAGRGRLLIATM